MQEGIDQVYDPRVPVTLYQCTEYGDSIGIIDTDGMKIKTRKKKLSELEWRYMC